MPSIKLYCCCLAAFVERILEMQITLFIQWVILHAVLHQSLSELVIIISLLASVPQQPARRGRSERNPHRGSGADRGDLRVRVVAQRAQDAVIGNGGVEIRNFRRGALPHFGVALAAEAVRVVDDADAVLEDASGDRVAFCDLAEVGVLGGAVDVGVEAARRGVAASDLLARVGGGTGDVDVVAHRISVLRRGVAEIVGADAVVVAGAVADGVEACRVDSSAADQGIFGARVSVVAVDGRRGAVAGGGIACRRVHAWILWA